MIVEWIDRPGAFAREYIIANALVNILQEDPSGLSLRFRAGPSFWFSTEDFSEVYNYILGLNLSVILP